MLKLVNNRSKSNKHSDSNNVNGSTSKTSDTELQHQNTYGAAKKNTNNTDGQPNANTSKLSFLTSNNINASAEDCEMTGNIENRISLLVKAAEKIVSEENNINEYNDSNNETQHISNQITVSQSHKFTTYKDFINSSNDESNNDNRFEQTDTINNNNNSQNYRIFIGKNGKPTRPFKAYTKEHHALPNNHNIINELNSNVTSPPLSSSSPIPANLSTSEQQLTYNSDLGSKSDSQKKNTAPSQQQQKSLVQLLSKQLQQQNNGDGGNSQVVINLEDVLNVILNAASIVSSQSPQSQTHTSSSQAQPQQQKCQPQTQTLIPSADEHKNNTTNTPSTLKNQKILDSSYLNSFLSQTDEILSQTNIGSFTGIEKELEFSSFDDITKMSLISSTDFCSQYKKRIQQAKERLIQKRQQEQALAKQEDMDNQYKELKSNNNKKGRKRPQSSITNLLSQSMSGDGVHNKSSADQNILNDQSTLLGNKSSNELSKLVLMNDLNHIHNLKEKQQTKFQIILSALNDELQSNSGGTNSFNEQEENLNNTGESLLNSYPPKKRHRMHQQHQEQEMLSNQKKYHAYDKSPSSALDESEQSSYETDSGVSSNNEKSVLSEKNQDLPNVQIIQNMSVNPTENTDENHLKHANESNNENNPSKQAYENNKNDISVNANQNNGCSYSSSSSSMSTSPTPQSSPSIYMDSASSSSSSGASQHNNLNRYDINQTQNSTKPHRPSRDLSNNSNSSSRSSSTTNTNGLYKEQIQKAGPQKNCMTNTNKNTIRSVIDIDQMADGPDKDEAYRERRRKNNEAAKRSRDARRAKEDDIALRAAILERENLQLKVEVSQLKQETNKLRCLLYNS